MRALLVVSLFFYATFSVAYQSEQIKALSAADYAKLPNVSQMAISPSGAKLRIAQPTVSSTTCL